jgi:glutathione S-transferase
MTELLGLPYSPWSEKARWALDVRRVPYTFRHYQPLLGEPALRLKLRRLVGRVSVPVLTADDGQVFADSADIARWADGRGEGPALFPAGREAEVARFVTLSERGLAAGRSLSLVRLLRDDEALAEMLPRGLRGVLGPLAPRMGAFGVARTLRKYRATAGEGEEARRVALGALDELREALAKAPAPAGDAPRTLLGALSFADIAAAQVLVFVEPPSSGLKMGAASRRSFGNPELLGEYGDLVAWRDALYRAYRASAKG